MSKKIRKGNILITFIIVLVLSVVAFSMFFILSGRLKSTTGQIKYTKALNIAEAGINKAIWYLSTPVNSGGNGTDWRTSGLTEQYSGGQYTIIVANTSVQDELIIVSTGELASVSRTLQVKLFTSSLPAAFDYAIFSGDDLRANGSVQISGDLYADGNIDLNGDTSVVDGKVYYSEDGSVGGSSSQYEDGGTPNPEPEMPTLDTSFYDTEIAIAHTMPVGDVNFTSDIILGGTTMYVNGDVSISSTINIFGPGKIVATGQIKISGQLDGDGTEIIFISEGKTDLSGSTTIPNSTFYAAEELSVSGTGRFIGDNFLTSGTFDISGSTTLQGLVYSEGKAKFSGSVSIVGSIAASETEGLTQLLGNVRLTYDADALPQTLPPGLEGGELAMVKGSWKEL